MPSRKPRSHRRLTSIEKIDLSVARTLALDEERPAGKVLARFAELGDQPPLALLSLAVAAAGTLRKDEKLARTGLRMLAALSITTMAKRIGKGSIDRTRPEEALENGRYCLEEGDSHASQLRSMPSGHSAGATAVAFAAARDYPKLAAPAAGLGGAILLAQLPTKNHFLSDVVAGAAIGVLAGVIANALIPPFKKIRLQPAPLRPAQP